MYCSECGAKLSYQVSKPKFCSECGETISGVKSSLVESKAKDISEDEVPSIKGLDYEISASQSGQVNFGSIIGTNQGGKVEARGRSGKKSEDPLGDSIAECAPRRDRGK